MSNKAAPGMLSTEERRAKYSVPAVEKALDVLEYLAEQAVPVTQSQLARALRRQPGEIFRMLTCLEARGYLRRDAETGGYALTLRLFELSRTHSPFEQLLAVAGPTMRRLAEDVRESCHLSVLHREQVLVLAQEESPRPFRLSVEVGSLHSVLRTTSGRILLSSMDQDERDGFLNRLTEWQTWGSTDRGAFTMQIEQIIKRGHERAEGERFVGGIDLGVPIGGPSSSIKAALIVAAIRQKEGGPDLDAILPRLRATADAIALHAGLAANRSAS